MSDDARELSAAPSDGEEYADNARATDDRASTPGNVDEDDDLGDDLFGDDGDDADEQPE